MYYSVASSEQTCVTTYVCMYRNTFAYSSGMPHASVPIPSVHHATVAWQHTPVDAGLAHPFGYMLTQRPLVCVVVVYHPHPHSVLGVLVCVVWGDPPTVPSGGDSCHQFTEGHTLSSLLYCSHHLVCVGGGYAIQLLQSVCTLHHKGSLTFPSSLSISCLLLLL